jgi:hypothetical protein
MMALEIINGGIKLKEDLPERNCKGIISGGKMLKGHSPKGKGNLMERLMEGSGVVE